MGRYWIFAVMLATGAMLASARPADAQGWNQLPGGGLAYVTNYVTSGVFTCGNARYILGSCLSQGNSLTLVSGTSVTTLTFHGISQQATITVNQPQRLALGSMSITYSGTGPRQFPGVFGVARLFSRAAILLCPQTPKFIGRKALVALPLERHS